MRDDGFYWVSWQNGPIEIAQWSGGRWTFTGSDARFFDVNIRVLSERIVPPTEIE